MFGQIHANGSRTTRAHLPSLAKSTLVPSLVFGHPTLLFYVCEVLSIYYLCIILGINFISIFLIIIFLLLLFLFILLLFILFILLLFIIIF